jgi:hypothetical protein
MPRVIIEQNTSYYDGPSHYNASCIVRTEPIKISGRYQKDEDKYETESNLSVNPLENSQMDLVNKINHIGMNNDLKFITKTDKKLNGITGKNRTTHIMDLKPDVYDKEVLPLLQTIQNLQQTAGGSRRRRRPSRKYKKSAKRVFRKKSRSTRRR